jgi:hypothetical protein
MIRLIHGSLLLLLLSISLFAKAYNFEAKVDKNPSFIGESFKVKFIFSFDDEKKIAEVNFTPPTFNNLKIKDKNITQTKNSQIWIYTLYPTSDKNITISSAYLDIALKKTNNKSLGNFDEYDYDYDSLSSSPIILSLKNSNKPKITTKLYGKFDIKSFVKQEDRVTKLSIEVNGSGNFEDIGKFNLDIKDATIYEDEPIIKSDSFLQKFVIISQKSFTIPAFELVYTDSDSKKVVKKKTKSIFIEVKVKKEKDISKPKIVKDNKTNFLWLLGGIVLGFLLSKLRFKKEKVVDKKLYEKIKDAKNTKGILKLLLSFDSKKYEKIIKDLEDDLYISKNFKLSKKELVKKIFTQY